MFTMFNTTTQYKVYIYSKQLTIFKLTKVVQSAVTGIRDKTIRFLEIKQTIKHTVKWF